MKIVDALVDERSGMRVEPLLQLFLGAALALACGLRLHYRDRVELGSLAALPLAAGAVKEKRERGRGWEWECGGEILMAERNVARDARLGQAPKEGAQLPAAVAHTGEKVSAITWQWPGDGRVFLVPREILELMGIMPMVKDVIIAAGHMYREQHYPGSKIVKTSYRQLADLLALEWAGGRLVRDLDDALTLARWVTIKNYPVIRKLYRDGRVKEFSRDTFGFIDRVSRIEIREGRRIPRNKQPLEICLSEMYAFAVKTLPAAPVPMAALEAAHRAPQRLRTPVKNLVYYLASRVPLGKVQLALPTLAEILGYQTDQRRDKLQRACENAIQVLYPVVVKNFNVNGDVYTILLAGKRRLNGT